MTGPTLVLGLGNELFTDEGLGIEAARRVERLGIEGIEIVDGGTLGLELVPILADRHHLLVLDAIVSEGAQPGELIVLDDPAVRSTRKLLLSAHQIGLPDALAAADLWGRGPAHCAAVGMVPYSLETGYGLSTQAEAVLQTVIDQAVHILSGWGLEVPVNA